MAEVKWIKICTDIFDDENIPNKISVSGEFNPNVPNNDMPF